MALLPFLNNWRHQRWLRLLREDKQPPAPKSTKGYDTEHPWLSAMLMDTPSSHQLLDAFLLQTMTHPETRSRLQAILETEQGTGFFDPICQEQVHAAIARLPALQDYWRTEGTWTLWPCLWVRPWVAAERKNGWSERNEHRFWTWRMWGDHHNGLSAKQDEAWGGPPQADATVVLDEALRQLRALDFVWIRHGLLLMNPEPALLWALEHLSISDWMAPDPSGVPRWKIANRVGGSLFLPKWEARKTTVFNILATQELLSETQVQSPRRPRSRL